MTAAGVNAKSTMFTFVLAPNTGNPAKHKSVMRHETAHVNLFRAALGKVLGSKSDNLENIFKGNIGSLYA